MLNYEIDIVSPNSIIIDHPMYIKYFLIFLLTDPHWISVILIYNDAENCMRMPSNLYFYSLDTSCPESQRVTVVVLRARPLARAILIKYHFFFGSGSLQPGYAPWSGMWTRYHLSRALMDLEGQHLPTTNITIHLRSRELHPTNL